MFKFKLRYCEARMVAFLNGELSLKARRRMARYIDGCSDCYAEYVRQRELQDELERRLPVFGQPRPSQLDRIWAAVQDEMQMSPPPHLPWHMRYGLATLALLLSLLLPVALLGDNVSSVVAVTPPTPKDAQSTSVITSSPYHATQVAVATLPADVTGTNTIIMPEAVPQRTPQPGES
jgi:anti-sigma factor RsiW